MGANGKRHSKKRNPQAKTPVLREALLKRERFRIGLSDVVATIALVVAVWSAVVAHQTSRRSVTSDEVSAEVIALSRLSEFELAEIKLAGRRVMLAEGLSNRDLASALASSQLHVAVADIGNPRFGITQEELHAIGRSNPEAARAIVECTSTVERMNTTVEGAIDTFNERGGPMDDRADRLMLATLKDVYSATALRCRNALDQLHELAYPGRAPTHDYADGLQKLITWFERTQIDLDEPRVEGRAPDH